MHLNHQAKFLVGVKPFLAIKSFLILILIYDVFKSSLRVTKGIARFPASFSVKGV